MHDAFFAWGRLAMQATQVAIGSAQVIAHRTARMAQSAPDAADHREFALMGREKVEAAVASAQAMALPMLALNQQLAIFGYKQMLTAWTAMFSVAASRSPAESSRRQAKFLGDSMANSVAAAPRLSAASTRVARSGIKPVASRVRANAARLNRKKK